eukprot:gb/GECG01011195.1/.p1 GENE.gb/GECG01011195.1/~~gb/GECG01011195.1/.p1  ORF type:complete len:892 (+),score=134.08 gb/GECG01011195.1/:1-2676(+)
MNSSTSTAHGEVGGSGLSSYLFSWLSLSQRVVQFSVNSILLNPVRICVVLLLYLVLYLVLALLLTLLLGTIRTYILQHAKAVLRHQGHNGQASPDLSTPNGPGLHRADSEYGYFGMNLQQIQPSFLQSPWATGAGGGGSQGDTNRRPLFQQLGIFTPQNEASEESQSRHLGYRLTQERSTKIDDFGWNIGLDGTWKSLIQRCREERFSPLVSFFVTIYLYFFVDWRATWGLVRWYAAPVVRYISTSRIVQIPPQGYVFLRQKLKDLMAQVPELMDEQAFSTSRGSFDQFSTHVTNSKVWLEEVIGGFRNSLSGIVMLPEKFPQWCQQYFPQSFMEELLQHRYEVIVALLALIALIISFLSSGNKQAEETMSKHSPAAEESSSRSRGYREAHDENNQRAPSPKTGRTSNKGDSAPVTEHLPTSGAEPSQAATSNDSKFHSGWSSESSNTFGYYQDHHYRPGDFPAGSHTSNGGIEAASGENNLSQVLQISSCQSLSILAEAKDQTSTTSQYDAEQYHGPATTHSSAQNTHSSTETSTHASNDYQKSEVDTVDSNLGKRKEGSERSSELDRQSCASFSIERKPEENNDAEKNQKDQEATGWGDFNDVANGEWTTSLDTSKKEEHGSSDQYSSGRSSSYWDSLARESTQSAEEGDEKPGHRKSRSQPPHVFVEESLQKSEQERFNLISHFDAVPAVASPYRHQRTSTTPSMDRNTLLQLSSDTSIGQFQDGPPRSSPHNGASPSIPHGIAAGDYASRQTSSSRTASSGPDEVSSDELKSEAYYPKTRERRESDKAAEANRYSSALPPRIEHYHSQENKSSSKAAGIRGEHNSQGGRGGASSVSTSMLSTLSAKERRRAARNERRSNLSGEISNIMPEADAVRLKQVFKDPEGEE